MDSGGNMSRHSSNNLNNENDENVNAYFEDAREKPVSKIPPIKNSKP